jgi:hypothetical protein
MKLNLLSFTIALLFKPLCFVSAQSLNNPFPAGANPDRIVLNITEMPSTSLAVTWRTCDSITDGFAEIMEASSNPADFSKAKQFIATPEALKFEDISVVYHSVVIKNLLPKTAYMYRVGNGKYRSEWFLVKTAGNPGDKLSFIYLGDVQVGIKSFWSQVIRQAFTKMPDANVVMYAGDIVNHANDDSEWGELFYGGSFIHSMIPGMMSTGNHEYAKSDDKLSVFWRPQFTLPLNGPSGLEETCYFTDIQGVRFISLNSNQAEESEQDLESQKKWLEALLKNNPNKWTCVIFHHPIYSISANRDNPWMRDNFKPLFDKYKVDLVMQGHDHAYARGMKKIKTSGIEFSGTMYVVSVSGAKMYQENQKPWMDKLGGHTQLYQLITVDGKQLSYKCYTATGKLYDSFKLIKQEGKKNRLVEEGFQ